MALRIRILNPDDVPFADHVRGLAGWNQTPTDWLRFLAHEPEGCFLAEWEGQPAGTVTTTAYGTDLAWIGMMLVHPDFRRKGIATALMEAALGYLRGRGVRCIKLDATPDGQPVYERLGFLPEWDFHRWSRSMTEIEKTTVPSLALPPVPYDAEIFGADRRAWLDRLVSGARVVVTSGSAYGMLRAGIRADYLGPSAAAEETAGEILVRQLLSQLRRETFWDIPGANHSAVALARQAGFQPVRTLMRMYLGGIVSGIPRLQFALADPATG